MLHLACRYDKFWGSLKNLRPMWSVYTVVLCGLVRRSGLHSRRACMIPNISRLWVGYLRSGAENIFEEKAIGSHLLSCCCLRRAPEATNEASEKIRKGLTESESLRIGLEVKAS